MPKKSRKSRGKYKIRSSAKPLAVEEASHHPQLLTPSPKQAPVAKSTVTTAGQSVRYPYVLSELRRSLTIAAVIFILLIVLYFLPR